jgi:hypothetical protein
MPSEETNRATREEWRELDFHYDRIDDARIWVLTGSRRGLLRFRDALVTYASRPGNDRQSEHDHYGPYIYLKVMTWPEAGFDGDSIRGSLEDLKRLARIIQAKVTATAMGESVRIQEEFAPDSPYALVLNVRDDDFDPASADAGLPSRRKAQS